MKQRSSSKHGRSFVALFVAAVFVFTAAPALADTGAKPDKAERIVGSWSATFTPAPGDPSQFLPLPALFSFTSDGIVIETDGGSLSAPSTQPPAYSSPGQGAWRQLAPGKYAVTFLMILVNKDGPLAGTLLATGKVQLTVTVDADGDHLKGKGHYEFSLPDGTVVASGDELLDGARIKA